MSYLIAAYAVTIAALAFYGLHLARERRVLRRLLEAGDPRNPG